MRIHKVKLESLSDRYDDMAVLLSVAEVIMNQGPVFVLIQKSTPELEPVLSVLMSLTNWTKNIAESELM